MRRFSALMAAIAATFAVASAQATVIVVDDFNNPVAETNVFDTVGGDAGISTYSDANRTIRHKMITAGGNGTGINSSVTVGGATIPAGNLVVRNADTVTSEVTLEWALAPYIPLPTGTPVSLYFKVYSSDAVTKNIAATASIGTVGNYSVGFVGAPGQTISFALSAADIAALNGGGTFALNLTGDLGWDISLDEVGFQIPEPSALALAGLALIGAGVASRRRRA